MRELPYGWLSGSEFPASPRQSRGAPQARDLEGIGKGAGQFLCSALVTDSIIYIHLWPTVYEVEVCLWRYLTVRDDEPLSHS